MLVLGIGFLYHITNDFIISNAISETIEEESETEEEPDCEWNYNNSIDCDFYSCSSMGNIKEWNIMKI